MTFFGSEPKKKKMSRWQEEENETKEIVKEIIALEKNHPQKLVKRACYKYSKAMAEKTAAEKEIEELNLKLVKAKEKLK